MNPVVRPLLMLCIVLLVPVAPFLLFGDALEAGIRQWRQRPHSAAVTAAVVCGLLSTDVLLPVPSSVVSTLGGWRLGVWGGSLASWAGMTIGAVAGYGAARLGGRPLAARLSGETELDRMERLSLRMGPSVLVVSRAIPVLAEASVLWMGAYRLPWRRFWPPVVLSNLGVSLAYSAFGNYAQDRLWMPLMLAIAMVAPLLLWLLARRRLSP